MPWWSQLLLVLVPAVASGIFGGAVATWLRTRPKLKEIELQGEAALWTRIAALEASQESERKTCDERIERIESRHAEDVGKLEREVRVLRHDRNNVRQALNAMFVMLKREDANVPAIVADIEDMLERGDKVIALEKGALTR